MPFSASYDLAAKIISAFVCLFLLAAVAVTHILVVAAPVLLIILVSYAYSPRGYVVADRSILVQRLAGQARIALDDVPAKCGQPCRTTSVAPSACGPAAGSSDITGCSARRNSASPPGT